jgi:hypothetical protein
MITVSKLKRLLADWPEVDGDGRPTEVWIQTGQTESSPCVNVMQLNVRTLADGAKTADLLLEPKELKSTLFES